MTCQFFHSMACAVGQQVLCSCKLGAVSVECLRSKGGVLPAGRRLGPVATDDDLWQPSAAYKASVAADAAAAAAQAAAAQSGDAAAVAAAQLEQQQAAAAAPAGDGSSSSSSSSQLPSPGARWAKRKRLTPSAAPSNA